MLKLGLVVAAAFVLQILLGMMQMKHFSDEFVKLRRCGRVACGRKAGGFYAGAIVMFLIDDEGYIKKAGKWKGLPVWPVSVLWMDMKENTSEA